MVHAAVRENDRFPRKLRRMAAAPSKAGAPADEYHSYVMRVRVHQTSPRGVKKQPTLSVRVEHVNTREAMHFNQLSGAFDFIAESVRRNVLHPDP
jgi:hypothetical protein